MPSTLVAIDQSIVERLDSIANSLHLSGETALRQAITNFIEDKGMFRMWHKVFADIEAGNVHSNVEVSAYFSAKRNALKATFKSEVNCLVGSLP